ncbi:hypothetical protein ScPMuIL_016695 [Solemya velum]
MVPRAAGSNEYDEKISSSLNPFKTTMMHSCSESAAKCLLVFFNLIFMVSGAAVLGIGIWVRVDPDVVHMQNLIELDTDDKYLTLGSWVLIGFGAMVLLVGVFGCVGGLTRNRCFLGLYIFFLLLIFGGEIAGGSLAAVFNSKIDGKLKETLGNTFKDYEPFKPNSLVVQGWDWVQEWLTCCASNDFRDYKNITFTTTMFVPNSCCKSVGQNLTECQEEAKAGMATNQTTGFKFLNNQGCADDLEKELKDHIVLLIGVGIGIAFVQLMGIVLACCICRVDPDD